MVASQMDLSFLNVSLVSDDLTSPFLKKKKEKSCFYTRHLLITQSSRQINGFILNRLWPAVLLQHLLFLCVSGPFPFFKL